MRNIVRNISWLLCCIISLQAIGQVSVTNTGILYISGSSDVFYLNGALTNNAGAALTNNGNLYVSGTLTNNQSGMSAGSGTLFLNGNIAQSVAGAATFKTNHLNTDNSAGITLNNDLSVSGVHTYTNGLIASSSTPNYLIYEAGSSYTGATDSRHVTGWVKKNGSTGFIFPVGDNSFLRSIEISSLSGTSEFNASYQKNTQNLINLFSPIVQVRASEWWQLDKISGGTAIVTLNWDSTKVPMDNVLLQDILVAKYESGLWRDQGGADAAIGSVGSTGSVTSNAVSVFGQFTLGYKTFPVPLKLISFNAERRDRRTSLQWITENEQSVSHFEIQRSFDATRFTTIATVNAHNTVMRDQYAYQDATAFSGLAWYRLRMVDIDGKAVYSKIVVVSETTAGAQSFLVMNPAHGAITVVNKSGRDGNFNYRLYTMSGQLAMQGKVNMLNNAPAYLPLPGSISSGMYLLEIGNENSQLKQQVLVER